MASLENKSGDFVAPDLKAAEDALASVKMPEDLRCWLPDPEGKDSYPIVTYTWLLCYKKYPDAASSKALKSVDQVLPDRRQKIECRDGLRAAAARGRGQGDQGLGKHQAVNQPSNDCRFRL